MLVADFIDSRQLLPRLDQALAGQRQRRQLLDTIRQLPLKKSSAVRRLGSYLSRGGRPLAIRLQFALEEELLVETFLHELVHCLDHLVNQQGRPYRQAHGSGWRSWAEALGINPGRCGESEVLRNLEMQRLKVVAVCRECGFELKRLRRLPKGRSYLHISCGGRLLPT